MMTEFFKGGGNHRISKGLIEENKMQLFFRNIFALLHCELEVKGK